MTIFEELPFVYQVELLSHLNWFADTGLLTTRQQLEDAMKQEAIRIWDEQRHEQNNILINLTPNNSRRGDVPRLLNRLLSYRRTEKFGQRLDLHQPRIDTMNELYQKQLDKNQQLQNQVNQQQQTITNLNNTNAQLQTAKTAVEQELAKLKKEHATCTTTIQALEKEKEALQKKVNELNEVITGVPQPQVQTEARVQQTSLLPK